MDALLQLSSFFGFNLVHDCSPSVPTCLIFQIQQTKMLLMYTIPKNFDYRVREWGCLHLSLLCQPGLTRFLFRTGSKDSDM